MRRGLLLLGPTGAGKTPLGELLAERGCAGATCVHFDFGDQLRRIVAANRPDERIGSDEIAFLKSVLESGALLEREHLPLAIHILESFLETAAATEDAVVVLNGFPRHVEQAEALEGILQMSLIVHLSCSDEAVLQRMKSNVGGDRTDRVDDAPEAVRQRLATYARRTAPLVDHYARQGATLVTLEVTGQTTPEQVWTALDAQAANLAGW
ncbi:MAG: nucleoside monophosphate kinase [Pirellulales bacterium]|nr:nucleoside monophosphate kinase [Pirellulales bacterium]